MNNLPGALFDGLTVAGAHGQLLGGILLVLFVSQFLLHSLLKGIFGDGLTTDEAYALSLAGWLLPASIISLAWLGGAVLLSPQSGLLVLTIILLAASAFALIPLRKRKWDLKEIPLSLLLLTGLLLILRLAFVSRAVLPLYFDSAEHYRHIDGILSITGEGSAAAWSLDNYYHLGFHFLAAFVSFLTRGEITDTMLVLGQVILAVMPFPAFFLVRHASGSNGAGLFALALAAFGWYMPAHAVDWGKYPALASLALIPFVVGVACLVCRDKDILSSGKTWSLAVLLPAGALVSVFLHSRSAVVFGILAVSWALTTAWKKLPTLPQFLVFLALLLTLLLQILFIQTKGILGPLFDPYGMKALPITASVLFLSLFAWREYPGLMFACTLSIAFLLASLFIPLVDAVPGYARTTLLDRPYVETILHLPLALLGGFGLAGLQDLLREKGIRWGNTRLALKPGIAGFFILLVAVHALFQYNLYPSDCCDIVSEDDLAAIQWLESNLPRDARILAASTELNVLPTDEYQGSAGGDAGAWITPLTGRPVTYLPFHTDFSQQQTLDALCRLNVGYVYAGKTGWTFDDSGIAVQPGAYRTILALPGARVYEVTGCE